MFWSSCEITIWKLDLHIATSQIYYSTKFSTLPPNYLMLSPKGRKRVGSSGTGLSDCHFAGKIWIAFPWINFIAIGSLKGPVDDKPSLVKVDSFRLSDTYMHHQPRPSLVQIMACPIFGAKPLSEPMLYYVNWILRKKTFSFKKTHLKISSGKCQPFCLGLSVLRFGAEQPTSGHLNQW